MKTSRLVSLLTILCLMMISVITGVANADDCTAVTDLQANTLHVPCLEYAGNDYWVNFNITSWSPVQLQMTSYGQLDGNALLSGAWILDNGIYMLFNGFGDVIDSSSMNMMPSTYQIESDGSITLIIFGTKDGGMTFEGQVTSDTTATFYNPGPFNMEKVSDISQFEGTWTGTLTENDSHTPLNMTITVDSQGRITSISGFDSPVGGRLFGIAGNGVGIIRNNETSDYSQIQLNGTLSGNSFTGIYAIDNGGGNDGTFSLTR